MNITEKFLVKSAHGLSGSQTMNLPEFEARMTKLSKALFAVYDLVPERLKGKNRTSLLISSDKKEFHIFGPGCRNSGTYVVDDGAKIDFEYHITGEKDDRGEYPVTVLGNPLSSDFSIVFDTKMNLESLHNDIVDNIFSALPIELYKAFEQKMLETPCGLISGVHPLQRRITPS